VYNDVAGTGLVFEIMISWHMRFTIWCKYGLHGSGHLSRYKASFILRGLLSCM